MDERDREILERMSKSLEEISGTLKKQQPSNFDRVMTYGATGATIFGVLSIIDMIIKWFR